MAEPGETKGAGGGNPLRADEGRKLVREISLDVSPAEESLREFSDKLKVFEEALSKYSETLIRTTMVLNRFVGEIEKTQLVRKALAKSNQDAIRALEMSRRASEEHARAISRHARSIIATARYVDHLSARFAQMGTIAYEFEEAARNYVSNIASLFFLPFSVMRGFYQSGLTVIAMFRKTRDDIMAFDRAVISSIFTLSRWAERGGIRGKVAGALRTIPLAYAKLTRTVPRRVGRAIKGVIRRPDIMGFLRSVGWAKQIGEMVEEQKGMRRLLLAISGGVGLITGFFTRLLRYVWEMLILQRLRSLFGGIGNLLGGAIGGAIATKIVPAITSALSNAGGAIAGFLGTAAGIATAVVGAITVAGKIGEALGVNADVIERASGKMREKAEEAEKHGNAIASAFYNTSAGILDFSKQVWIAGDQAKDWLSTHVPVIGGALGEVAQGFLHGVSLLTSAGAMISDKLGDVATWLGDLGGWLSNNISSFITNAGNALSGLANWIGSQLQGAWNTIVNGVAGLGNWVQTQLKTVWNSISGAITGLGNWVDTQLKNAWNTVSSSVTSFGNWAETVLKNAWNGVVNTLSGAWNSIVGFFSGIAEKLGLGGVAQALSNASNAITGALSNASKGVTDFFSGVASKISDGFNWLAGAVGNLGKALTGSNPGVITHLEELGASLRETSNTISGLSFQPGGGDQYSFKIIDLFAELIEEVRMLREDVSKSKPEVNIDIRTSENLYLRRR